MSPTAPSACAPGGRGIKLIVHPGKEGSVASSSDSKSVLALVTELKDLVIAYAKQETVDPLKALVRFVLYGVVGAILLAIGGVLVALAIVRAIQSEAGLHLSGDLSWVPYVGGVVFALAVAGLAVSRIAKVNR
jgi:hypothetical protein